ncbi:uncharacterized protein [Clytia hemisphaerica]|uniref:uncharacterized protein n=1 Tax=Clytia hemisphaerica TaxID=252671 RepID=UPI0034D4D872
MDEESCREFLCDYFGEGFTLELFNKFDESSEIKFKCNIASEDDVVKFVDFYMQETNETLKVKVKKKEKPRSIYKIKATYRCQHDTRYEKTRETKNVLMQNPFRRFQNTNCRFQITFKVLKNHLDNFPCSVHIENSHNHAIYSLEALSFRTLTEEVKTEINSFFTSGLTASQAYIEFMRNLRHKSEDDLKFHINKADRSKCPGRRDFNFLYAKWAVDHFGGRNGVDMLDKMEEKVKEFLEVNEGTKIAYQLYDKVENSPLILTIVTPLMQRIHSKIRQASELVFIDSTSNLDEHNLRFFLLLTHSVCGALPLGIVITSYEQELTLSKAFKLLKSILPEDAFFNTPEGPSVIMTDNCKELHNSLRYNWPNARLFLCTFHILQQVWRWLYEKAHGISKLDRVKIMQLFRRLLYAEDIESHLALHEEFFNAEVVKKYNLS